MKILLAKSFYRLTSVGILARGLRARGHEVHVLVPAPPPPAEAHALRRVGVPTHVLALPSPGEASAIVALRTWAGLLRRERFDVLHLNLSRARLYGRLAAFAAADVATVSTIRGDEDRYQDTLGALDRGTVTVSRSVKAFLAERGHPTEAVHVIPNGIEAVAHPRSRGRLHQELGVPLAMRLVGMVAYLRRGPVKGHDVLLEAARQVLARTRNVAFVFVGSSLAEDELLAEHRAQAKSLGLAGHVHFVGERDDVRDLLPDLTVHVLPSRSEGCPMALLEAMVEGVPNVVSDIPAHREILTQGEHGLLTPVGDAAALAGGIVGLLENPDRARNLAAAARRRAEGDFSATAMAEAYEKVFADAAQRRTVS